MQPHGARGGPLRGARGGGGGGDSGRGGRGGRGGNRGGRDGDRGGHGGDRGGGRGGPRGGAPRGGAALVGLGPPALPAAHVGSTGVRRPGFGTAGTRTRVIVNALEIATEDAALERATEDALMIYHYDGNQYSPYMTVATPDKTYPPRLNVQLIKTLQHDTAPQVFHPAGAYDGKKNRFMPHRLDLGPGDSRVFDVILPANGHPIDRPPPVYKVKISFAAEINTTVLHRFIQGTQTQDEKGLMALTALNVLIRADPIMNHPFNVRSFFPINGERVSVGHGFELVRGYFQSVRPAIGRLLINVDISTGLIFKPGPLFDVAFDFFNIPAGNRNPTMFSAQGGLDPRRRLSLQRFLTNVRVSTGGNHIISIARLSDVGADQIRFAVPGGGEMTVAQHFHQQQNQPLRYPMVLCVMNRRGSAFPFEKCTVLPGQIARKQIPPELTSAMVDFSRKKPDERMNSIRHGIELMAYGQSEYIRNFGLTINIGPFPQVDARVINPPQLKYGRGSKQPNTLPKFGTWNMKDKKFVNPTAIHRWAVVVFESSRRVPEPRVREMIKDYISACNTVGNRFFAPHFTRSHTDAHLGAVGI
ncbi:hypothetical protein K435DRAFT_792786 [Dendrothele bispora CBS 962.96]|uniref:Argonaute linker 1 domain-containing protein n=1 Tax=Dendrothele bispora (strain CBS 962.96) TaxID=1314807 RepID=A0A4S8MHG2_DENBC|nr:hypothetical protein K435DRAFT_792786 [Dendrothele bispora CBS 962.96]